MIVAYILDNCSYSAEAEKLLKKNKIKSIIINVPSDENIKNKIKKKNKMNTFPQLFIKNDNHNDGDSGIKLGGYTELCKYTDIINHVKQEKLDYGVLFYLIKNMK